MFNMVKEIKKVPEIRFPEFDGEWENFHLGDLADVTKLAGFEYTKHVVYQDEGKIIALRALNVKNNQIILNQVKYIDGSEFEKLDRSKLFKNDMMLTYVGANIGDVALIPEDDKFYMAPNIARIRSSSKLNPIFLLCIFNTRRIQENELAKFIASSSQPALSMGSIRQLSMVIPTLPEQQKIAAFLSAVDQKIQQLTRKKELLEQYKKGVIQKIFSREIRFKDDNEDDYPDWEDKKIQDYLTESRIKGDSGETAKKLTVKLWGKGVFAKEDITQGSAQTQYYRRKSGQFIYSKLDFLNCAFGIVSNELNGLQSTVDLPCFDISDQIDPKFLLERVKQKSFYKKYGDTADGSRKAKRIHADVFGSFPIHIPCMHEQKKIVGLIKNIENKLYCISNEISSILSYKKGLLQKMFV